MGGWLSACALFLRVPSANTTQFKPLGRGDCVCVLGFSASLPWSQVADIADKCDGYSGADLASLCREASLGPIRESMHAIAKMDAADVRAMRHSDFLAALKRVSMSMSVSVELPCSLMSVAARHRFPPRCVPLPCLFCTVVGDSGAGVGCTPHSK